MLYNEPFSAIMFTCIVFLCANAIKDKPKMNSPVISELKSNSKILNCTYIMKPLPETLYSNTDLANTFHDD
jgi:hypothetical protein